MITWFFYRKNKYYAFLSYDRISIAIIKKYYSKIQKIFYHKNYSKEHYKKLFELAQTYKIPVEITDNSSLIEISNKEKYYYWITNYTKDYLMLCAWTADKNKDIVWYYGCKQYEQQDQLNLYHPFIKWRVKVFYDGEVSTRTKELTDYLLYKPEKLLYIIKWKVDVFFKYICKFRKLNKQTQKLYIQGQKGFNKWNKKQFKLNELFKLKTQQQLAILKYYLTIILNLKINNDIIQHFYIWIKSKNSVPFFIHQTNSFKIINNCLAFEKIQQIIT